MRSWKTTLAGLAAGIAGICNCYLQWYNGQPIDTNTALTSLVAIVTAIGLFFAKDHNVSGTGPEKQKPE